ncbi:hypothetical protein AB0L41_27490 [Amycolatopsis mediterranei]
MAAPAIPPIRPGLTGPPANPAREPVPAGHHPEGVLVHTEAVPAFETVP